jgi:hypothetical protein
MRRGSALFYSSFIECKNKKKERAEVRKELRAEYRLGRRELARDLRKDRWTLTPFLEKSIVSNIVCSIF